MAPLREKRIRNVPSKSRTVRRPQGRGSWFELVVFLFIAAAIFLIGTLLDSSWTGLRGRLLGNYLRTTWGGALLIPLLFLIYLCIAWFAKTKIPRPLGQILGTIQLYLSTAFMLGLFKQAHWDISWMLATPGLIGNNLARFFVLNLGVLGTIVVAFASLALSAILFGFKLPVRMVQALAGRFMEGKPQERRIREEIRASKFENIASPVTIRPLPRADADDLMPPVSRDAPVSTPVDGLVMMDEELVASAGYQCHSEPLHAEDPESAAEISESGIAAVVAEPAVFETPVFEQRPETPTKPEAPEESGMEQTETPATQTSRPQTASEILERLLASLEAEKLWDKIESQSGENLRPVAASSLVPDMVETEEPLVEPSPVETEQVAPPPAQTAELPATPDPVPTEQKTGIASPLSDNGLKSAVQETFPEVELPEEEDVGRIRAGVFPPPLDIFGPSIKEGEEEIGYDLASEQADIIVTTLANFGVKASVAHIVIGPSVIQFQLELAPGIKVSKVSGLANDLTMALAVVSVRVEAPILGQHYVGIEIPNPRRKGITLRSIMDSGEFQESDARLPLPMGVRVDSQHLVCGLEDMPHLLVAGTTGSGKSVFTNTCILGMCSQRSPEELKLILVDPKHVEFAIYEGLPHLLARPVSDPKKAIAALSWAVQEMETRSEAFARAKVRNLASYNEKALPKSRFPHIVVVVDELADLMYTAGKEVEGLIARLAQKARAAGIHLILATQRPSVDVITGLIKANVPARVAFAVPSQTDSRTIIDMGGAEKLLGKGDMLFYSTRYPRPLRLQASFITEERTLEFVEYMKNAFGEPEYIEFEDCANGSGGENGGRSGSAIIDDPKLEEAIKVVMDTGIASASGLQRYLNIGYPRAGRVITGLEQLGIVGPQSPNSSKPREILMDEESAYEILERARNGGIGEE